ncbi:MAG TPA: hypothetical protein VKA38_01945 [Draconibacterium sp.]|nr:hypothetical protein [Draconibacterium sp.]
MNTEIPVPITFNPQKHHFAFLKKQLQKWRKMNWEEIRPELLNVGSNLLDFYFGKLPVERICAECIDFLQKNNLTEKDDFFAWSGLLEYRKIELSDHSFWVVKKGLDPIRFVHIHPAKQSPHTLRVRATTLKTVLALQIHSVPIQKEMKKNLEQVNKIRVKYLQLSPIKSLQTDRGILRFWNIFNTL